MTNNERIAGINLPQAFAAATVLLPVMNETHSLTETLKIIEETSAKHVVEYIILTSPRTEPESLRTINELLATYGERLVTHCQTLPYLGGAIREGFALARGSHVVMMASDLETDPNDVSRLIAMAALHPEAIITATRWNNGGSFIGYSPTKLLLNRIFQRFFSTLYRTSLTDLTYGYRLFPTSLVQAITWSELRHSFLLESILKPLKLAVQIHELPSAWKARSEGTSSNTFAQNFAYFRVGFSTLFKPTSQFITLNN